MDSGSAGNADAYVNGSGDHHHRHTSYQTHQLEQFYIQCSHPGIAQREQLSKDLGLTPKQVHYWFQNRRTQAKAQVEKSENDVLKAENQKLKREINELKEAQHKSKCSKCEGSWSVKSLEQSQNENINSERVSHQSPVVSTQQLPLSLELKLGQEEPSSSGEPFRFLIVPPCLSRELKITELNKNEMIEMAVTAMHEITKLLESGNPFWVKSPLDGSLVLDDEIYNKSFPRTNRFKNFTQIESSKDSTVVAMSMRGLVEMFMDPNNWLDVFPTVIAKARKIEVLDTSMIGDDAGTLQLMHAKLHILSPLVAPREFYFLRYAKEIRTSRWIIVDISCDYPGQGSSSLSFWKLPSGCLVQDKSNGCSEITWIEHVEVDSRYKINDIYKNIFSGDGAYGTKRWLVTLQWMVEKIQCYTGTIYHCQHGAINMLEMKRSIMDLSHRMVKQFVAMVSLSNDSFINLELHNGGHVSVSRHNEPGQASRMVLDVSSSVRLPFPCTTLFNFLRDEKKRAQWDMLTVGNMEGEFGHISCGIHPGNRISLFRTSAPDMMLLQETCMHDLGSLVIYAPIPTSVLLEAAVRGHNPENIPFSPAGFIISNDEKGISDVGSASTSSAASGNSRGSILTVAIPVNTTLPMDMLPFSIVERTSNLTRSIVERIKIALDYPNQV